LAYANYWHLVSMNIEGNLLSWRLQLAVCENFCKNYRISISSELYIKLCKVIISTAIVNSKRGNYLLIKRNIPIHTDTPACQLEWNPYRFYEPIQGLFMWNPSTPCVSKYSQYPRIISPGSINTRQKHYTPIQIKFIRLFACYMFKWGIGDSIGE